MSVLDVTTLITAVVAVVGLLLSIYNFYVNRKDKTPRLSVKMSMGLLARGPITSPPMIILEAANTGERMVKVTAVEIKWNKQNLVFFKGIEGTKAIPFELQPGDNVSFWTPTADIAVLIKEMGASGAESIRACFKTAIGREYFSKYVSLDVEHWTQHR